MLVVIALFLLVSPCISWTTLSYMNLVSPPRWTTDIGDAYIIKNGTIQPGYTNHLGSCLNKPTPSNVTRTQFPISGGQLLFEFVNNTGGWPNKDGPEKFWIDLYFTDDNAEYGSNGFFRWGGLKRMQFWQDFSTGMSCSVPLEMKSRLREPGNATALAMLNGLNVTLALLIHNSRGPRRGDEKFAGPVFEEVDQCAYVTLTSDSLESRDVNDDMCNRVNLNYFGSTTTSAIPTATSNAATTARGFHTEMSLLLKMSIIFILIILKL